MSATDLAAVILAVTCLAVVAVATLMVLRLRAVLAEVSRTSAVLRDQADTLTSELAGRAGEIEDDLRRVDGLLERAERVSARADTLSRMTYGAVARPVIRTAAVMKGTSRAARRLRAGPDGDVADLDGTG